MFLKDYLILFQVTIADMSFLNMGTVILIACNEASLLDKFPKLKALMERVEGLPKIAEWIAARPKTNM